MRKQKELEHSVNRSRRQRFNSHPHRTRAQLWGSVLYHISFYLFLLIVAVILAGAAWALGEQAWRKGGLRRWNLIIIVAAYIILVGGPRSVRSIQLIWQGIVSLIIVWNRLLTIKRTLKLMPRPYIPNKQQDIPQKVADHIMAEYSRTAVVAHISQATTGQQEGWGRPETRWENKHFRTYILEEARPKMCTSGFQLGSHRESAEWPDNALGLALPASGLDDQVLVQAATDTNVELLVILVNSFIALLDKARYSRQEPNEVDASAADRIVTGAKWRYDKWKEEIKDAVEHDGFDSDVRLHSST